MPVIDLPVDGEQPYGVKLRAAINAINDAVDDIGDPWTSYTPTFTNFTLGNGSVVARYKQNGKTVFFHVFIVLGSTSTVGTVPSLSLPVTAYSGSSINADAYFIDVGTALVEGRTSTTTTNVTLQSAFVVGGFVTHGNVTATTPFTWTNNDRIAVSGFYEAA